MYKRILSNPFIQGSTLLFVSSFVVSILNYFFNLLIARSFSLSDYGEYTTAISYITIFGIPFGALTTYTIRKIAQTNPVKRINVALELESGLIKLIRTHPYALAFLTILAIGFFLFLANLSVQTSSFILIMTMLMLFQSFYLSIYQAEKNFKFYILLTISFSLCKLLGLIIISKTVVILSFIYLLFVITTVVFLLISRIKLFSKTKYLMQSTTTSFNILGILKRKSIQLPLLSNIGLVALINLDIILAKIIFSAEMAGLYGSLSLISKIIFFAVSPLLSSAYIFLNDTNSQKQLKIMFLIISSVITLGTFACSLYYMYGEFIVLSIFDSRYIEISPYLWIAGLFGTFYSLTVLFSQYFLVKESYWSALPIIGSLIQGIVIVVFGVNFVNMIVINSIIVLIMVIIYILVWVRESLQSRKQVNAGNT